VEQFWYLGKTLTNQNSIQEENKCRLKSQNACYHSVQKTIYKTAHLKVFTNYWMYPVPLFASICPYSKQKSTYTSCLREVRSVLNEKYRQYKQLFRCSARTFTATLLSPQQFSCPCAPSLRFVFHISVSCYCLRHILCPRDLGFVRVLGWYLCLFTYCSISISINSYRELLGLTYLPTYLRI
jgi:hypothetical protein